MTTTLKAQAPFDVVANGETMPAGESTVTMDGKVISITNGRRYTTLGSIASESRNESKETAPVFPRYGDSYFLASIKRAGKTRYELAESKFETELHASKRHLSSVRASSIREINHTLRVTVRRFGSQQRVFPVVVSQQT